MSTNRSCPVTITTEKGVYQCLLETQINPTTYSRVGENITLTYILTNTGTRTIKGLTDICTSIGIRNSFNVCLAPHKRQIFTTSYLTSASDVVLTEREITTVAYFTLSKGLEFKSNCTTEVLTNTGTPFTGFTGPTGTTGPANPYSAGALEYFYTYVTSSTGGSTGTGGVYVEIPGTNNTTPLTTLIPFQNGTGSAALGFLSDQIVVIERAGIYGINYGLTLRVVNPEDIQQISIAVIVLESIESDFFLRIIPESVITVYPGTADTYNVSNSFVTTLALNPVEYFGHGAFLLVAAGFQRIGDTGRVFVPLPETYAVDFFIQPQIYGNNVFYMSGTLLQSLLSS